MTSEEIIAWNTKTNLRPYCKWAWFRARFYQWLWHRISVPCCTCPGRCGKGWFTLTGYNVCESCRRRRDREKAEKASEGVADV